MDPDDRALQLYKLEYEKAAERYENIYRSMWTIFSYLTAVAAGILTFGGGRIERYALICMAAGPLLFWFWTTYLPLDRYGNATVNRLCEIEHLLNARFDTHLSHFTDFARPLSVVAGIVRAFINPYYRLPCQPSQPQQPGITQRVCATLGALWRQIHRARFAICLFFIVLHVFWFCEAKAAWKLHESGQPLFRGKPAATAPVGPTRDVTLTRQRQVKGVVRIAQIGLQQVDFRLVFAE